MTPVSVIKAQAHDQRFAVLAVDQCSANGFGSGAAGQAWSECQREVECEGERGRRTGKRERRI